MEIHLGCIVVMFIANITKLNDICSLFTMLKVMCYLVQLQVAFTTLVYWKGGSERIGGMDVHLFFLSLPLLYVLHWHA